MPARPTRLLPRTVRGTLFLAFGVLLLAHVVILAGDFLAGLRDHRERAVQNNLEVARAVASSFQTFTQGVLNQLTVNTEHARQMGPQHWTEHLAPSSSEVPAIRYFAWLSPAGELLASDAGELPGPPKSFAQSKFFQDIAGGEPWVISEVSQDGAGELTFYAARAVRGEGGGLQAVLVAAIDPSRLEALVAPREGQASVSIIDRSGRGVFRRPAIEQAWELRDWARREPAIAKARTGEVVTGAFDSPADGERRVFALVPVAETGWVAAATVSEAEVLDPVFRELATSAAVTLGVALGTLALVLLLVRRITGPFASLRAEALALGGGALDHRAKVHGPKEVEEVAQAFNLMAQRLEDRERRLREESGRAKWAADVAEWQSRRLQVMVDTMPEGVFLAEGPSGAVVMVNATARRLMGREVPEGTLIEREAGRFGLLRPDGVPYPPDELPLSRALKGEVVLRQEVVIRQPSGVDVPVMVNCAPVVHDGRIEGAVAVFQDVTALKEAERVREEVVHLVSHDLRNPLAVVLAHVQLLGRRLPPGDEANRRSAAAIGAAAKRMSSLVADLLESTRVQDGKVQLERASLSLPELVQRYVASLLPAEAKRVRVEVADGLPQVWADADRLDRVLANLVGNALKYSEGEVTVRAELGSGELVVSVRDQGPGIDREAQAHLFERYYRAPGAGRKEGLGLGLYIARQLVRAHGGRIWVESEPGRGAAFRFSVPLATPMQAAAPPPP